MATRILSDREAELILNPRNEFQSALERVIHFGKSLSNDGVATFHQCGESFHVRWELGFGTNASLYMRPWIEYAKHNDREVILRKITTTVSWPSVNRSTEEAAASLAIYRRAVEAGLMIQSMFEDEYWQDI